MGSGSEGTLLWFARMVDAHHQMDAESRSELYEWERLNIDGSGAGTSDWPGWAPLVGACPPTPLASPEPRRTWLYRLFGSDGRLLYVGVTYNWPSRRAQHAAAKPWWGDVARCSFTQYGNRQAAEAAERAAIRSEAPRYNAAGLR